MNTISAIKQKVLSQCEAILYLLVTTLVFEGIVRKFVPFLNIPVFFFKDLLCIVGIFFINDIKLIGIAEKLRQHWKTLFLLFIPLLCVTGFKELILAVFACKQYLLYVISGIIVITAFPAHNDNQFRKFAFYTALLLIPTTAVAILQNALPPTHWLNLSVTGDSLEEFAAAGYLRVGSTFSFTGQYSWFLNAESYLLSISYFMPIDFKFSTGKMLRSVIYFSLALMLIVSAFITGGRTAVIGCGATLTLGFFFIGLKAPSWVFPRGLIIIALCIICFSVAREVRPQFFAAYDVRSNGYAGVTQNEEISTRVIGGFTDWTSWFWEEDITSILLGNGLGVMSNGSSQVSAYASQVRANGFWTEGDVPTTFWEGGIYLAVIWYGFRLSMILLCFRLWNSIKDKIFISAAAVPLAYVIISGCSSQFGMQPPLYIWWSIAIGMTIYIYNLDRYKSITLASATFNKL